jgi:thymidylate synthase (FAD)
MAVVRLIAHTPNPEKVVAIAARLCYTKFPADELVKKMTRKEVKKGVQMLNELRHESPIEHASFTFLVSGISRACMAQITRHRIASFSVRSQRYVNEAKFEYVTPPTVTDQEHAEPLAAFDKAMKDLHRAYQNLNKSGILQEDARFVLPNACSTQLMCTMNARALKNFFTLRCCGRAQWEIRAVANKMLAAVKEVAPSLFANAGPACVRGACPEGKMSEGCPVKAAREARRQAAAETAPQEQPRTPMVEPHSTMEPEPFRPAKTTTLGMATTPKVK